MSEWDDFCCRVVGEGTEYVDFVSEENGTDYQCKSAVYEDECGQPGVLRFNLHHPRSPPSDVRHTPKHRLYHP